MRAVGYRASAKVADTGRMWTKSIWDNIPWDQIEAGEREGAVFFDDFKNMPDMGAADAKDTIWATFVENTGTIKQGAANEDGEVILTTPAGDNDQCYMATGGDTGGMFNFIKQATDVPHLIAFEARMQVSTLLGSAFVGFAEEGLVVTDGLFDDNGVFTDKDYVGFSVVEATPTVLDFGHNKESGTDVKIVTGIHTLVADTYVKVGCLYDYRHSNAQQIKVFLNGVVNASYTTKTQIDDATNFPAGEEMVLFLGVKNVTDIKNLTVDWVRAAMLVLK